MGDPALDAPITLDQLRVFLTVVETGSFSKAARRLRRVQSAISYSIANLERLLSVELFDRSGRMPVLTDAGRALLPDARAVCERMDQLHARAHAIDSGVEPQLSVAVDMLFPMPKLIEALREFSTRFPLVTLHLRSEALGAVTQLVLDGTCQLGISVELAQPARELTRRPITTIEMVPVAAATHPLARGDSATLEQVRDEVQIVIMDRSPLTAGQDRAVYSERTWRVADLDTKREMILAGFGWGLMPSHRVRDDLSAGPLALLTLEDISTTSFRVPLYAVFRTADPPGPAGLWLLDRLAI